MTIVIIIIIYKIIIINLLIMNIIIIMKDIIIIMIIIFIINMIIFIITRGQQLVSGLKNFPRLNRAIENNILDFKTLVLTVYFRISLINLPISVTNLNITQVTCW